MRTIFALTLLSASTLAAQPAPKLSESVRRFVSVDAPVVALAHVRLVDGTGAPARDDQTVVIQNGRILTVGPSATVTPPAGATVMDLAGHTVLPGFVGLHDHTFYTTSGRAAQLNVSAPRLYLASGVTTIRTTGSNSPYQEINLKRSIDVGEAAGPAMLVTGPYLTGEVHGGGMQSIMTPEDARRTVDYWASEGATWLKFYTTISRSAMKAAIDQAHKRGLKTTGHLCSVSFREAVALGIDNLEHGLLTNTDYLAGKAPDVCPSANTAGYESLDVNGADVQRTFREMIARRVPMTSTLAVWELFVPGRPPMQQRVLDAMSPEVRGEYLAARERLTQPNAFNIPAPLFRKAMDYELAFVKAGGLLAAGVDPTGNGGALPGFGDQRNYELLLETGFAPEQAIQIMTLNGAKVLGLDARIGTVAAGKQADLVVVRGDPVRNPADIANAVTVFRQGVGYDSAKLVESVKGMVGVR
jgi:imidazolonepropionase-like amidohydrolase